MPAVTIDGVQVTVEAGTNVIEAAFKAGKVVPHFCYHPKLSVAGNCRMCLVEIEGMRKPEIACNTTVRDGMVVRTETEKVKKLRQGVLEFLFLNHPLDCPICDKAGECKLQDYYLDHGQYTSRLHEGKVRKPKRLDIGRHIVLDTERCVLCSRCVRFTDEITKTHELRIFERGSHSNIGIWPDKRLDNRYSLCTTDVCPVGALTSKDFRFSARVWYLDRAPSVCGGCSTGCNIEVHSYRGEVKRFMPRRNDSVNDTWMCDDGRLSYHALQAEQRVQAARLSEKGVQVVARTEAALERAMRALQDLKVEHGAGAIGVVLSPQGSLEENWLLGRLGPEQGVRVFLVTGNPVGSPEKDEDGYLIRSDKNPNTAGARLLASQVQAGTPAELVKALGAGSLKALVVLNNDVVGKAVQGGQSAELFGGVEHLIVLGTHESETTRRASVVLPLATYPETEGTWVNAGQRVQRFQRGVQPKGEVRTGLELAGKISTALGAGGGVRSGKKVFAELAGVLPALAGMSYESLGTEGQQLRARQEEAA